METYMYTYTITILKGKRDFNIWFGWCEKLCLLHQIARVPLNRLFTIVSGVL